LYDVLHTRLGNVNSLRALEDEASVGPPRDVTRKHVELDLQDQLSSDPGFAAQVAQLVKRAQAEQTTAGGTSSNELHQRVELNHLTSGRDINTNVSSRSKNTKIAIGGGGALLALALLFVWFQYSTDQAKTAERTAYQGNVISTCERIQATGTFSPTPHVGSSGIWYRRSELEQELKTNMRVVKDQTSALLALPAPAELSGERAAVDKATAVFIQNQPRAVALVHALPKKVTLEMLQNMTTDSDLTQTYNKLGDALTRLAGSTCSIEAQSHPGSK
jgi:hypothetical protein